MLFVVIRKNPQFSHKYLQQTFMRILSAVVKKHSIQVKIKILENECINDVELSDVGESDFILWTPLCASQNLALVKKYHNSVVILENKTTYIRKISDDNPVNENMSINHDFKILYLREYNDITNDGYKLITPPQIITFEEIIEKLKQNDNK